MTTRRFPWIWLFVLAALAAGFGIGLGYAWTIAPVPQVDAEPHALQANFKDNFRSAIAAAYASNADLERARARLDLLGDPDPSQALAAQAQRMLAAGEPARSVQQVALLASALQGQQLASAPTPSGTAIPTNTSESPSQEPSTSTVAAEITETVLVTVEPSQLPAETEVSSSPVPQPTATLRPTTTPTPTLGAPYQLVGQDTVCDTKLAEGLMQVVVTDSTRRQVPGAEIIITWNSGEEHIFSGLKPELGHGYADFQMEPDVSYSVRMAEGGTPASELSAPACTMDDKSYTGGIKLTFQQP